MEYFALILDEAVSNYNNQCTHQPAVWDGRDGNGLRVASGLFLYRLQAGEYIEHRKMVLLK